MEQTPENKESSTIIKKWVEQYTAQLFSWAYYKVSEKELAADLVQDTFLAAFRSFSYQYFSDIYKGFLSLFVLTIIIPSVTTNE
jgi:DNA-directed RNA polymerase specialized sigma24 family protein